MHSIKSTEKSEVIQKVIFSLRWNVGIKFYIFQYFTSLYNYDKTETALQTACVRKLFDWNRGLPRSFLSYTASLQLKMIKIYFLP